MIKAEIVAYSVNKQSDELMSVLSTFPRIILAEVNTHRMLSKNTSSSRAIPYLKMVDAVLNNPFIPIAWQKNHPGMQGSVYLSNTDKFELSSFLMALEDTLNVYDKDSEEYLNKQRELNELCDLFDRILRPYELIEKTLSDWWLFARDKAVEAASILYIFGVTKQLANRLLEPFMWTTMLLTGSKEGWDNFFHLRCPSYVIKPEGEGRIHKSRKDAMKRHAGTVNYTNQDWLNNNKGQAEIHMMALAEAIWDAKNESTPKLLQPGEWHIPFEDKIGHVGLGGGMHVQSMSAQQHTMTVRKVKVSTAMGARTSYTIVGEEKEINPEILIGLHDKLIIQQPPHSSPMEHCSQCMTEEERNSFVKGKLEFGTELDDGSYDILVPNESELGWCYNHKGFIPYRYMIDNNITL